MYSLSFRHLSVYTMGKIRPDVNKIRLSGSQNNIAKEAAVLYHRRALRVKREEQSDISFHPVFVFHKIQSGAQNVFFNNRRPSVRILAEDLLHA